MKPIPRTLDRPQSIPLAMGLPDLNPIDYVNDMIKTPLNSLQSYLTNIMDSLGMYLNRYSNEMALTPCKLHNCYYYMKGVATQYLIF